MAEAFIKGCKTPLKEPQEQEQEHQHGTYNGVMGKGSFTKKGDKFQCLECAELLDTLPEEWVKANPDGARLLLKGQTKDGPKDPKMQEAGRKAWATRRKNKAKK